jgi:hypothetical protein
MASNRYAEFLPVIAKWIQETLDASAGMARSVKSFHFPRLPHYFSEQLLRTTNVVVTDRLPVQPKRWPTIISGDSILGSRYTQSRRKFGRRRWR